MYDLTMIIDNIYIYFLGRCIIFNKIIGEMKNVERCNSFVFSPTLITVYIVNIGKQTTLTTIIKFILYYKSYTSKKIFLIIISLVELLVTINYIKYQTIIAGLGMILKKNITIHDTCISVPRNKIQDTL